MSVSLETAIRELGREPLADPNQHLKPRGRQEVLAEIETWQRRGLRAHVLVVDPGDSFTQMLSAWEPLRLDPQRDLLLVFNTRDWVARGWGLDDAAIGRILASARPHQPAVFSRWLITALAGLGEAARPAATSGADQGSSLPVVGGIGLCIVAGVLGLAIRRRNQLAKLGAAKLAEAQRSAERTYTELILACEELPRPEQGTEIQLRAAELKRRLDKVIERVRPRLAAGNDPVRIGEVRQLEDELAALRSTVLQKMKERP
ncbi:MAG: hypothetical protein ABI895_30490 [Deltaproteobacteria bacterium]